MLTAFQREIKALNDLRHPNIIKILSIEKTVNNMYVNLEFCNGGTLSDLLKHFKNKYSTGIPEGLAQRIIQQLVDGLGYMHSKRLMHRDLKLDNILITYAPKNYRLNYDQYEQTNFEGFQVKIADLGFSRECCPDDPIVTICGTPINFPPDFFSSDENGYNLKADLWSLGSITYEILIGVPPFLDKSYDAVVNKIKQGCYEYPKNCTISIEAISFINCLLTYNPEKRFSTDELKIHPFITENPMLFNPMTIDLIPDDVIKNGKIFINTKDNNNFIWSMFNNRGAKPMNKIETKDLEDKEIMMSLCVLAEKDKDEKRDLLSRFRKDRTKHEDKDRKDDEIKIKDDEGNNKEYKEDTIEILDHESKEENKDLQIQDKTNEIIEENVNDEIVIDWDSYSFVEDKVEVTTFSQYDIEADYIKLIN